MKTSNPFRTIYVSLLVGLIIKLDYRLLFDLLENVKSAMKARIAVCLNTFTLSLLQECVLKLTNIPAQIENNWEN